MPVHPKSEIWDEWLEMLIGLQRLYAAARLPQPQLQGTGHERQRQGQGPVFDSVSSSEFVSLNKRCASRVHETDGALLKLLHTCRGFVTFISPKSSIAVAHRTPGVAPKDAGRA